MTTQRAAALDHPNWCVGAHDDPAELTDSVHEGRAYVLSAERDDVELRVQLRRWDERPRGGRPGTVGETGALLTIAAVLDHRPDGGPLAADAFLTTTDLRALARRCDQLADQAEAAQ